MTVHRIGDAHARDPDPDDDETSRIGVDRFMWERHIKQAAIPPLTKLVALTMATYAGKKGDRIHPGDQNLAADCGITDRAIRTHRKALEELGFIEVTRVRSQGRAAEYRLTWPRDFYDRDGYRGPGGGPPIRF